MNFVERVGRIEMGFLLAQGKIWSIGLLEEDKISSKIVRKVPYLVGSTGSFHR